MRQHEASQALTAGSGTLKIDASGVILLGASIKLNSGGSPSIGAGSQPHTAKAYWRLR